MISFSLQQTYEDRWLVRKWLILFGLMLLGWIIGSCAAQAQIMEPDRYRLPEIHPLVLDQTISGEASRPPYSFADAGTPESWVWSPVSQKWLALPFPVIRVSDHRICQFRHFPVPFIWSPDEKVCEDVSDDEFRAMNAEPQNPSFDPPYPTHELGGSIPACSTGEHRTAMGNSCVKD